MGFQNVEVLGKKKLIMIMDGSDYSQWFARFDRRRHIRKEGFQRLPCAFLPFCGRRHQKQTIKVKMSQIGYQWNRTVSNIGFMFVS